MPIDVLEHSYLTYFESYNLRTLNIPNVFKQVDYYFDQFPIEGIILTGGEDIDPRVYGENIEWSNISPLRDQTERRILEIAFARKIPVLGICRGMQFINTFFGGTLVKSIKNEITTDHIHGKDHKISLHEERIISAVGKKEIMVNSFHNQAVTVQTLSAQLRAFALTEEGIIEGIYHPLVPIAGIQWHPERKSPDEELNIKLMEAFVKKELFWK